MLLMLFFMYSRLQGLSLVSKALLGVIPVIVWISLNS